MKAAGLRSLREKRGFTQVELAEHWGIHRKMQALWDRAAMATGRWLHGWPSTS